MQQLMSTLHRTPQQPTSTPHLQVVVGKAGAVAVQRHRVHDRLFRYGVGRELDVGEGVGARGVAHRAGGAQVQRGERVGVVEAEHVPHLMGDGRLCGKGGKGRGEATCAPHGRWSPVPRMAHGVRSAPSGRCTVWEWAMCGPEGCLEVVAVPAR